MSTEKQPKCLRCDEYKHLEFDIGWEEIIDNSDCINNPEGSAKILWLCPKCIRKMEIVKMKEAEIENMAHGLEEAGKIMKLLSDLGFAIDHAKEKHDYLRRK